VLLGAVGFVLLIAFTNLANLALRLVRQLLTESMLLAETGGILGLAIAELGVRLVRDSVHLLPRVQSVSLDSAIVLFTAAISIFAGLLFGILPARAASGAGATTALKQAARGNSDSDGASARDLLAAAEVAMAIVLLAGAGLLMRSFLAQRAIEPGFATHNVLSMEISLAGMHDYTGERRVAFDRQVMQQAAAVPGIRGVAIVNHLPIGGDVWYDAVHAEGHPLPKPGARLGAVYRVVSPGYFPTMDIALRDGCDFTRWRASCSPRAAPWAAVSPLTTPQRARPVGRPSSVKLPQSSSGNSPQRPIRSSMSHLHKRKCTATKPALRHPI
jgi:putative ABC transport system permease protein